MRTVYAQVRLTSARRAMAGANCATARRILDSMSAERAGLPFTRGGLADAFEAPVMVRQIADIEWTCGRRAAALERWRRLEERLERSSAPLSVAVWADAHRRLGGPRLDRRWEAADIPIRIERAAQEARRVLEAGSTSSPGLVEYAHGMLLASLGRQRESQQALRRVFIYPDRGLSHALARQALRTSPSRVSR